jgi:tRNA threonylcarbamoyladenosine biosynthesis protein TsaB
VLQIDCAAPRALTCTLVPAVQRLLADAGVAPSALRLLAVDCGPGSFTGIRIGLAVATGLADAWGTPTCGISQFDLWPAPTAGAAHLVVLDAQASHGAHYQLTLPDGTRTRAFATYAALADAVRLPAHMAGTAYSDQPLAAPVGAGWRVTVRPGVATAAQVGRVAHAAVQIGTVGALTPLYVHAVHYQRTPHA